jgi:hypothetical protein
MIFASPARKKFSPLPLRKKLYLSPGDVEKSEKMGTDLLDEAAMRRKSPEQACRHD